MTLSACEQELKCKWVFRPFCKNDSVRLRIYTKMSIEVTFTFHLYSLHLTEGTIFLELFYIRIKKNSCEKVSAFLPASKKELHLCEPKYYMIKRQNNVNYLKLNKTRAATVDKRKQRNGKEVESSPSPHKHFCTSVNFIHHFMSHP